ncbi:MAG: hypothetical protein DRP47_02480 [Candidatus Zixiibacteriota bacterium]|nr:MAG: hypothetical protein DRP47_02480 [candidate division Zixibacteria bacterium]
MYNKKHYWKVIIVGFFLFGSVTCLNAQGQQSDPVVDFYRERAQSAYRTLNPFYNGATISFLAKSYLTKLARGGREILSDSSIVWYFYSYGNLDSQQVVIATSSELEKIDFSYPNLFENDYDFTFFPNDVGGEALAIGIDSDTAQNLKPTGIAVINRNQCYLLRQYLYYRDDDKYKRYSKYSSFSYCDGVVFPDTVRVTYITVGIFSAEHFRRETFVDSLIVAR